MVGEINPPSISQLSSKKEQGMEILHTVFYTVLLVRRAVYVRRLHGDDTGIELGCCFVAIKRDRMERLQRVIMKRPKFRNH